MVVVDEVLSPKLSLQILRKIHVDLFLGDSVTCQISRVDVIHFRHHDVGRKKTKPFRNKTVKYQGMGSSSLFCATKCRHEKPSQTTSSPKQPKRQ